jgi:catechol 2,3-dioxygenase-like lactoylglutathione lyase family enzyme
MELSENISDLQHLGLPTEHFQETVDFYKSLGFREEMRTQMGPKDQSVAFLKLGNLIIEAYEVDAAAGLTGAIDHFSLDVRDIEAAYAAVQKMQPRMQTDGIRSLPFWEKGIRYFIILGPNEERIEFCQIL